MRIATILLTLFFSLRCAQVPSQTIEVNKKNRTVAVTATDQAEAPADLAAVTIGFVTFGADQTQTYAEATRVSTAIMDTIHAASVPVDAIESKEQSLTAITEASD